MGIIVAFGRGLRNTAQHWWLAVPLYLSNLIAALIMTVPVYLFLWQLIGHRSWAQQLARGPDLNLVMDLIGLGAAARLEQGAGKGPNGLLLYLVLAGGVFLLNGLAYAFLAGGVLETLRRTGEPPAPGSPRGRQPLGVSSRSPFWPGCRRWFFPFLRLWIISFFCLSLMVLVIGLAAIATSRWYSLLAFPVLLALPLGLLGHGVVFEYARISAVYLERRSMLRATGRAYYFFFRHFFETATLGTILLLVAVLILALYLVLGRFATWLVLSTIIGQQLYVLVGAGQKVLRLASQLELYSMRTKR
ncbi:MAG: hypothetical protein AB1566_13745 [Chloroflexota bacterium]